jgi:hypothetical protein
MVCADQGFQPTELAMLKRLPFLRSPLAGALLAAFAAGPVLAEQPVPNPLKPNASESRRSRPAAEAARPDQARPEAAKPETAKPETTRPARERSAAQKQNDEMMRACGQEWRAEKASLQAKGETWRSFLKDCRAKKKAEIRA